MKLRNKIWLIVVVIIIAVILGILFSMYSEQVKERNALSDRLSRAQTLLPGLVSNRQKLEDRLTQAESSLAKSQAEFAQSVDSIEYDDDLFKIANDCNVDITKLTSSKPTDKKIGTVTYSVSTFVVVVTGNIGDILEFLYAIRTGDDFQLPWSADVNNVKMDVEGGGATATINLDIYGYKG